ncbi:MAG: hypothetical protein IPF68_16430 [Bacteroidales bacterium]|nr:hypothetical protein [Bacteroidales bacterium]
MWHITDKAGLVEFRAIARGSVKRNDSTMWYPEEWHSVMRRAGVWLSDGFRRFSGIQKRKGFKSYVPGLGVA